MLPEISMFCCNSEVSLCIGLLKWIWMERESLMPKLVMRGIRLSGNEHAVLFCSAGVPPRGSIDGSHVVELDNGLLASRRSSDQPPSALKGSDLYQSVVYSTNEMVWLVLLYCLYSLLLSFLM